MSVSKVGQNHGVAAKAGIGVPALGPVVALPKPVGMVDEAQKFLDSVSKRFSDVDWNQFALMNNNYLVRHSELDRGIYISQSSIAYERFLKEAPPFFSISPSIFGELLEILTNIETIRKLYPPSYLGVIRSKDQIEKDGKNIYDTVESQLKKKGLAYFTFGYCGKLDEKGSSHALTCKVKRGPTHTHVYFMNRGEGAGRHLDLDAETTGYQTSFAYFPVAVKNSEWESKFLPFLYRLIRYISDTPGKEEESYSSAELYDLLHLLGEIRPDLIVNHADRFKSKLQNVGDCADKAVRNAFLDFLAVEKGLKEGEIDQVFLSIHFNSLLAAYNSFKKGRVIKHSKKLMINAIEQFGTHLLRLENHIPQKEFYLAAQMIHLMLKEIENKPDVPIVIEEPPIKPPDHFEALAPPNIQKVTLVPYPESFESTLFIPLPPFNPKTFKKDLTEWILQLGPKTAFSIHKVFSDLPIPKGGMEADDPWNQIPEEDLKDVLIQFGVILDRFRFTFDSNQNIVVLHSLFAIVDRLARRSSKRTKLDGFGTPFSWDTYENYFIFTSIQDQKRYLSIKSYFKQASKGDLIFPYEDIRSIETFIAERKEKKKSQGANHLNYLTQFNSKLKTVEDFKEFWFSSELPQETMVLYRYVLTCQNMFDYQYHPNLKLKIPHVQYFAVNDHHFSSYVLKYKESTGNEIPLIKEPGFYDELPEAPTVASLTRFKDLKVGKALDWIQSHRSHLENTSYQNSLESCFFSLNAFSDAIDENPNFVVEFRQIIENGLLFFQNKKDKVLSILFLQRLSFFFETILAEKTEKPIDPSIFNKHIERLKKLQSYFDVEKNDLDEHFYYVILSHLILFQSTQLSKEGDYVDFFTKVFQFQLATHGLQFGSVSNFLSRRLKYAQYQELKKFEKYLEAQGSQKEMVLNRVFNEVIKNIFPKSCYQPKTPLTFTFKEGRVHCADFILELAHGAVVHPNEKLGYRLTRIARSEMQRYQMKEKRLDHLTYWWLASAEAPKDDRQFSHLFISLDHTLWFFYNDFNYDNRLFVKVDKSDHLELVAFSKSDLAKLSFLKAFQFHHQIVSSDPLTKKVVIASTRAGEEVPYYHIEFHDKKASVTRKNGTLKLINLKDFKGRLHPLLKVVPPDEVLCFVNAKTNEVEEIELFRLNLSFRKNGDRWECLQRKGFYYVSDTIKPLGSLSQEAIILSDGKEQIKVILPTPTFEKREMGFDEPSKERLPLSFYTYDYHIHEESLRCKTLSDQLYLIYFYRLHGDFQKAQNIFNQISKPATFDLSSFDILTLFIHLKDSTPKALNFNLKLVLFVCDSFSSIPEHQIIEAIEAKEFLRRAQYWHLQYLRIMGHEKWGSVSKVERLTELEEARILSTYTREKIPQNKILELREAMIHDIERSGKIDFFPQDVDLAPQVFTKLMPPEELRVCPVIAKTLPAINYPNRLSMKYLEEYFPLLYAEALKAKPMQLDDFDYTLLAAMKADEMLGSLLFYVRHFQGYFKDLPYTQENLDKIQSRIYQLRSHPHFKAILAEVRKKVRVEVFKSNTVLIVRNEEIEALQNALKHKVLNLKKEMTEEEIDEKMGSLVTPEEMQELQKLISELRESPQKKALCLLEKSLHIFDLKLVRLPQDPASIATLFQSKKVLLVTEAEFQTHKHLLNGQKVTRFSEKITLEGLKKACSHQKILALPPAQSPSPLPVPRSLDVIKKPFEKFKTALFKEEALPSFSPESLFDEPKDELAKELYETYKAKHLELRAQKRSHPVLDPKAIAPTLPQIVKEKTEIQASLKLSLDKIDRYLNDPFKEWVFKGGPLEATHFQLKLNSKQTYRLTAEQIMKEVIIKGSSQLLKVERPMFENLHIEIIMNEVMQCFHLQALEKMMLEAEELMKKPMDLVNEMRLFELLNYTFAYDPAKYPEISYFIVKTGIRPRPDQLSIFFWVAEGFAKGENRLFQLPPGGGKTTVLTPLIILHLKRYRAMVSVNTTASILPVERSNLAANLKLLGEELGTFDLNMQTELSLRRLKRLHHDLKFFVSFRRAIINTPQILYALKLSKQTSEEGEKVEVIDKCLDLLKRFCIMLGDESHRTADPHTQALFGVGEQKRLPYRHRLLLLELMKPVLGLTKVVCDDHQEVSKLCRLNEAASTMPSAAEMALVQKALAMEASKFLLSKWKAPLKESILKFWMGKDEAFPVMPPALTEKDKNLILLVKYFLHDLLPKVLAMKNGYDHVVSMQQGEIDTPAYYQNPSHAQFKDSYLTEVLSIKGTILRGLTDDQWSRGLEFLKKQDEEEADLAADSEKTPSRELYKQWTGEDLRAIDLNDLASVKKAITSLKKSSSALLWYLDIFIVRGISYSKEEITLSPTQWVDGFKMACLFTGTPLAPLAYPRAIMQPGKLDEMSEVQVLSYAAEAQNRTFIYPETIAGFFAHMTANKASYKNVRALIAAGEFLCNEKNEQIALKWLNSSDLQAVLYFKDDDDTFAFVMKTDQGPLTIHLQSTDLSQIKAELLKKHRINFDSLQVGTYYDASHSESANIPQAPETRAIVFAGEHLTLSHAIQSIMRLRGFTTPQMKQSIIWAITPSLAKKMSPDQPMTPRLLFNFCLQNEVAARKSGILLCAFQEISHCIEKCAKAEKLKKGVKEKVDPKRALATHTALETTEKALLAYAEEVYKRFEFEMALKDHLLLKVEIQKIIDSTKTKIQKLEVNYSKTASLQMHQKMFIKKVVKKVVVRKDLSQYAPEPMKPSKRITDPDFALVPPTQKASEIFKAPFSESLYLDDSYLYTATQNNVSLKERFMKKIDFLVVTIVKNKFFVKVLSNDAISEVVGDFRNVKADLKVPHKAFVLRASGKLYRKGKGPLQPTDDEVTTALASPEMQDVMSDVALLNGKMPVNERFNARLKHWPHFNKLWTQVSEAQAENREYARGTFQAFLTASKNPLESLTLNTIEVL